MIEIQGVLFNPSQVVTIEDRWTGEVRSKDECTIRMSDGHSFRISRPKEEIQEMLKGK